jgi:methylated-DNA-[protein]-cysteine S-methyltransferase
LKRPRPVFSAPLQAQARRERPLNPILGPGYRFLREKHVELFLQSVLFNFKDCSLMNSEPGYLVFRTKAGWLALAGSTKGLTAVTLPHPTRQSALDKLPDHQPVACSPPQLKDLAGRIADYFTGRQQDFSDVLDLTVATPFQRRVWLATRHIPYGETRSYRQLAASINQPGAARAVGQALARNPLAIIVPCHRVIKADDGLGGFGGGTEMKRFLLSLEAVVSGRS